MSTAVFLPDLPAAAPLLQRLKCAHCVTQENGFEMPQLPLDTVPVPHAYGLAWPEPGEFTGSAALAELKKERERCAPTLRVRFRGDEMVSYIYSPVLRLTSKERMRLFTGYEGERYCFGGSSFAHFLKLDSNLLEFLQTKKASSYAKGAVKRCQTALEKLQIHETVAFLKGLWEREHGAGRDIDEGIVRKQIFDNFTVLQQLGRDSVENVVKSLIDHYGFNFREPQIIDCTPVAKPPSCFFNDSFWSHVVDHCIEPFSLTDEEAYKFRKNQITGKHKQLHLYYVRPRPSSVQYTFQLDDGVIFKQDSKTVSTLQRIAWVFREFPKDRVQRFVDSVGEEVASQLGFGRTFVLREEGDTTVICGLEFLRTSFLASLMYLGTCPLKDYTQAILLNNREGKENKNSLATHLKRMRPELAQELDQLDFIYNKMAKAVNECLKLKQLTRSSVAAGLYGAEQVLSYMFQLDTQEKSPEEHMVLAFLGLSFYLGLRSGEMGKMRSLSFKNKDLGDYMQIVESDGRLFFGSTSCKTNSNMMKSIPLPSWLERWVCDYDAVRHHLLQGQDHTGMWTTATGLAVHAAIRGEKSSKKGFAFDFFKKLLAPRFPEVDDFTDIRAIFFDGNSEECPGSMLNLIARSQHLVINKRQRGEGGVVSPPIVDREGIKQAMAVLFKSKSQQEYSEKCQVPLDTICRHLDAVKDYLWEELARRPAF